MPNSSDAPPTAQQTAALSAGGSVVLSSGAGCGKTFVLTRRFLGYLADHSVGEIVAITFTDRAAREMRQRIRAAVREKLTQDPDGGWDAHLRDLESATITTIHSFCGNLARQHAIALGIDPRFEILEEMLSVNLMDDAIRTAMQRLLTAEGAAGDACRRLTVLYGWTDVLRSVGELVAKRDMAAWEKWVQLPAAEIAAGWITVHAKITAAAAEQFFTSHPAARNVLTLLQSHASTNLNVRDRLAVLAEKIAVAATGTVSADDLDLIRESAKIHNERAKAWESKEVYDLMLGALKTFRDAMVAALGEIAAPNETAVVEIAEVAVAFARVALRVGAEFQVAKRRVGVMDFEDLLAFAHRLLTEHPAVLRHVRQRYKRLLLDEMQDTDPVQMAVVRLLTDDPLTDSRLFAVGDVKQSIYRFRGADVSLFGNLQHSVPAANRLPLTTNFRSQPPVLTFVNALFSPVFVGYEPLVTLGKPLHREPCVEFWWSVHGEKGVKADDLRALEAKTIAKRLRSLLDDRRPLVAGKDGTLRPMALGDVVLLFRAMSNVPIYEAALRAEGLDYYIVGGRAFFAQQEVYDVLNLLKALENPDDSVSLLGVLRSPFGGLSDETVLALGQHANGLWEGLRAEELRRELPPDQRRRAARVAEWLVTWRALKDRVPMTTLLSRVFADTGFDSGLQLETLGERKLANLWKLTDMARRFDRTGLFHMADFIKQLSAMVSRELREEQAATQPENADVVRLMSVHQSKGLEFPVVVLPDVTGRRNPGFRGRVRWDRDLGFVVKAPDETPPLFGDFAHNLAVAKEAAAAYEEEQRIFYVATTRAKDLLVLSGSFAELFPTDAPADQPVEISTPNPWLTTLNSRFHLATGASLDASLVGEDVPVVAVRTAMATEDPPKVKRPAASADPVRDAREATSVTRSPRAIYLDDATPDEMTLGRERLVETLAGVREPRTQTELAANRHMADITTEVLWRPSAVAVRHPMPPHRIDIHGTTDGQWERGVVVIDEQRRGTIRLGIAALASQGKAISLALLDPTTGTVLTISATDAKSAAERWLAASLKIHADAE